MRINVSHVRVGEAERRRLTEALDSGNLAQGRLVAELEAEFAARSGSAFAVATSSGTTALQLALEVAGVGPGDEVITSPFTFVATMNSILTRGAVAHLVDIDETTFNLRPDLVSYVVGPATKAVMPVHLYGLPADMESFGLMKQRTGIRMVEDAAQAHLATQGEYRVGTMDLGCFSLYATKNLTSGEGGLVTGADPKDEESLRVLRNQGMRGRYEYVSIGYNYRLTDLAAAIGLGQLERIDETMAARERNASLLNAGLEGIEGLVTPQVPSGYRHAWHQYTIRLTVDARLNRDELAAELGRQGIGSGVYYPNVLVDYPVFAEHPNVRVEDLSTARRVATEVLSLPVHQGLSSGEVTEVVEVVRAALGSG
ncbi:MAG TPA: DegT/DnrJ/EryC1/StrS family aminotransferase [Candidatus Dormibacteraeota bacterium]|nr:DegT/DnrJ/EryC1/StrS family aminotransferase [Candidatus Dormibacteraeota bacterium]